MISSDYCCVHKQTQLCIEESGSLTATLDTHPYGHRCPYQFSSIVGQRTETVDNITDDLGIVSEFFTMARANFQTNL